MPEFNKRMAKLRRQKKISQEELSRRSGVSQAAISMIEAGKRSPTETVMQMLADGLGVPLSALLADEETQKEPAADACGGLREMVVNLLLELPEDDLHQMLDYAVFLKSRRRKE